jgi:molecular chaperone GrpE
VRSFFARVAPWRGARENALDTRGSMDTEATPTAGVEQPDGATEPQADDASALSARLAEETARADDNHAKLLYALADFENYKKRAERQLHERLIAGKRSTLAKFLTVLDNLERALTYNLDSEGLRGGLNATQRGFESLLASENVKAIEVLGTPFDPRIAEAIGTRETDDVDDDTVVDEVQRGYTIGDELLRPARVIVSKRPSSDG